MIGGIWRNLKKTRKIQVGPVALAFRFERSTKVNNNGRWHWRLASDMHRKWSSRDFSPPEHTPRGKMEDSEKDLNDNRELAVVVGVGPGFGYALARRLAGEGIAVILVSRNAQRLEGLVEEIRNTGGFACAYGCDSTVESSVLDLFEKIERFHGVPSLVVYSVQSFCPGALIDIEVPAFEASWRSNCLGSFIVARSAARLMSPLGRGSIVLVGSTSSIIGRAAHLNLSVGKFGQRAIAQVLARELWPVGVHVAHVLIDADISECGSDGGEGVTADPDHIAESIVSIHRQPKTAWTSEMDIRPWNERFWEHC